MTATEISLPMPTQAFWDDLVEQGIAARPASREQALAVLATPDDGLMSLVAAAGRVRRHHFGRRIVLNYLVNVKSGICPEDCHYCSQSRTSKADILKYTWLTKERVMQQVDAGVSRGASTVCLVASGRGPSDKDMTRMGEIVTEIKATNPEVKVCACLGLLDEARASALAAAGVDRYNHNLNTAEDMYADICSTHTYEDRRETLRAITSQGISSCSGLIAGMGETDEQLVDVVMALRDMDADSIPVNFLLPFEGTPLEAHNQLTPQRCLKILAMVRFICPDREVRIAAGREYHIRSLQPLALEICNSIFLGDYLTSEGQATQRDLDMIADLGFEIVGSVATTEPEADDSHVVDAAGVPLRRRGAGVKS